MSVSAAPPADPSDAALVARARQGDSQAVVALYRRYVAEIYGYALNHLGNPQDAEDATSETFAHAMDGLPGYRGQASFRTWLYAIARNQLHDHWRRNGHPVGVPLELAQLASPAGAPGPTRPRWSALGRAVLSQLPPNYRRVLELRLLEERSVRDTATALGITAGNVKVLQHRALKRASAIADQLGEPDDDR